MGWKRKNVEEEEEYETPVVAKPVARERQEVSRDSIVNELPQAPTRQARGDDGIVYNFITTNEAMQEILEGVRELLRRR